MEKEKLHDRAPLVNATEITPVPGGMVEVVAPMDLREGYELQVQVNGERKCVLIPPGGVLAGQSFQTQPFADNRLVHQIPVGRWRDGLCDCLRFGCCHAMCCVGLWWEPVLTGQVMTRMSRDWLGGHGLRPSASQTCQIVTGIWLGVLLVQAIMQIVMDSQSYCVGGQLTFDFDENLYVIKCPDGSINIPNSAYKATNGIAGLVGGCFAIYMMLAICRTRQAIRKKYQIEAGCCGNGCEDCCCAFWCSCCTVQQMARHTNDYSTHDVACCSNNCFNNRGQQEHIPEIEP